MFFCVYFLCEGLLELEEVSEVPDDEDPDDDEVPDDDALDDDEVLNYLLLIFLLGY